MNQPEVVACVVPRDFVWVGGADAATFLQGQCSQDVARIDTASSAWTFLLQPTGKVDVFCRVHRVNDTTFVLDTDAGWGQALIDRLNRFKLRVKVDLAPVGWSCVAYRGPGAAGAGGLGGLGGWWNAADAVDTIGSDVEPRAGVALIDLARYERLRIEAGWPAMGRELTLDTIPAESGVVALAVSFTKGCFTGQELVARIDSRGGNVPRHLRRVVLPVGAEVTEGAAIEADAKVVGRITSVAGDLALGYVGRAVTPPAAATVEGVAVRIEAIPGF